MQTDQLRANFQRRATAGTAVSHCSGCGVRTKVRLLDFARWLTPVWKARGHADPHTWSPTGSSDAGGQHQDCERCVERYLSEACHVATERLWRELLDASECLWRAVEYRLPSLPNGSCRFVKLVPAASCSLGWFLWVNVGSRYGFVKLPVS